MSSPRAYRRLTAGEVPDWLRLHPQALLLDSRDEATFSRAALPGALRLHRGNQDELLLHTDRRRPVLIYCYHGQASRTWAQMFADFGFVHVSDLVGGYAAWEAWTTRAGAPQAG